MENVLIVDSVCLHDVADIIDRHREGQCRHQSSYRILFAEGRFALQIPYPHKATSLTPSLRGLE